LLWRGRVSIVVGQFASYLFLKPTARNSFSLLKSILLGHATISAKVLWSDETWATDGRHRKTRVSQRAGEEWDETCIEEKVQRKKVWRHWHLLIILPIILPQKGGERYFWACTSVNGRTRASS
jgi:hypothetical protein